VKKIVALGLAAVGMMWALGKSKKEHPTDHWAGASDAV